MPQGSNCFNILLLVISPSLQMISDTLQDKKITGLKRGKAMYVCKFRSSFPETSTLCLPFPKTRKGKIFLPSHFSFLQSSSSSSSPSSISWLRVCGREKGKEGRKMCLLSKHWRRWGRRCLFFMTLVRRPRKSWKGFALPFS